jgi:hypothetical protein
MNDLMKALAARKVERRRQLAALPVGEKLRRLDEMVAAAKVIGGTRPAKSVHPVQVRRQGEGARQIEVVQDVMMRYQHTLRDLAK